MAHIVSASRRTDIPAFYADWFMDRLRKGLVEVKNPFNPDQVSRVSLQSDDVLAMVFWTKHPTPLLGHLRDIEKMGHRFYFQFTLNDYPRALEPNLPPRPDRVASFVELSNMIGSERVVWRYDPIILSSHTNADYHRRIFENLCRTLSPYTRRVVVSLIDYYKKTQRNLRSLEDQGYTLDKQAADRPETDELLGDLAGMAGAHSLEIFSCAQERDYTKLGIPPGGCIDGELIESLWGTERTWRKDPSQRKHCLCTHSKDIGAYDTCRHACPYCYATGTPAISRATS